MTQLQRVLGWFADGTLIRPDAERPNFVDLTNALARFGGHRDTVTRSGVEALCRTIGEAERYVFVLIDGLGMHQLEKLPRASFLRGGIRSELQPVFMSTTAAALTTLATGEWPCTHGVPGWWGYIEECRLSAVMLPFEERKSGRSLTEYGVSPDTMFPVPSIWPGFSRTSLTLVPAKILTSVYSCYAGGGAPRQGYGDLPEAIALARRAMEAADGPGLIYLYIPHLDSLEHEKGTDAPEVLRLLQELDVALAGLAGTLGTGTKMIVSSDHGHTDVQAEKILILNAEDPLAQCLVCCPTGEATAPIFHVRAGEEERFRHDFCARFGEYFALLALEEVEALRLLGPTDLSPVMRRRMGTFLGIAPEPAKMYINPCVSSHPEYTGVHGGLTRAEMRVPLIVSG